MELKLTKKPKGPLVIEGFPGFGLVGTIATEFLIEHLKCEKIGRYYFEDLPATIAVHNGDIIDPVSIYYNKEYNLVLIHAITAAAGIEWEAADLVLDICKRLEAKEILSIEGVGSARAANRVFYTTSDKKRASQLTKIGVDALEEGIIVGVTSSLLMKADLPITCIFAETHSSLPDSKAAAEVIKVLDKILGLKVDPGPLIDQAERFEAKLKQILEQTELAKEEKDKKQLSYVG